MGYYKFSANKKELCFYFRKPVLNIFTDASGSNVTGDFCAGFLAYTTDDFRNIYVKNSGFQIMPCGTSNNFAEAYAIYMAVLYAGTQMYNYQYINIFSDSEINIRGLRDRIYFYMQHYDQQRMALLKSANGELWANQDILLQIIYYIQEMQMPISLYQIKGHSNPNDKNDMRKAASVFATNFNYPCSFGDNVIETLSQCNNQVDVFTREQLNRNDIEKFRYILPIGAVAIPNYNYDQYISLIRQNGIYCTKSKK